MKLKFRIEFDEPLRIDEARPLTLPNNGTFCVIRENRLATAFEVQLDADSEDLLDSGRQLSHKILKKWNDMRRYFGRLKVYIQCVAEINYDPLEVKLIFEPENDEEKDISLQEMVIVRNELQKRKRLLSFETLCGIAIGSIGETKRNDYFIGELKNLSLRAEKEGRYIDSFRYGFLLIDALYGKGKFKTKDLQNALKSNREFVDIVNDARVLEREKIGHLNDDTEKLLCGDCMDGELIDHLVVKRGHYFHGRRGVQRDLVLTDEEGKTLCRFVSEITNLICKEKLKQVLTEESWNIYENSTRASGNTVKLQFEATIIEKESGDRIKSYDLCEQPGSLNNEWNRLYWAYDALTSLTVDGDKHEVETIVGREQGSGEFVFSVELGTSETMSFEKWKPGARTGSEFVSVADVKFFFDNEVGEREAELRVQPRGGVGPLDNRMVQNLAAMAIFGMTERPDDGLYLVQGVERENKTQLFRILLNEEKVE